MQSRVHGPVVELPYSWCWSRQVLRHGAASWPLENNTCILLGMLRCPLFFGRDARARLPFSLTHVSEQARAAVALMGRHSNPGSLPPQLCSQSSAKARSVQSALGDDGMYSI